MPDAAEIVTIPCLSDNYAYLLHDPATGATAAVDVPEAAPILSELSARGWQLSDILVTHHHWDHVDGLTAVRTQTGATVWGAGADAARLPPLDRAVAEGDAVKIGGLRGTVLDVPGHTIGHIAYYFADAGALFSADSLMVMGCGRLFEGTAAQMWDSLSKMMALPDDTLVCSGHEYTEANARFALSVEPDNPDLKARMEDIRIARAADEATVPAPLSLEKATNPFLRAHLPEMKRLLDMGGASDAEVFATLRARKDSF